MRKYILFFLVLTAMLSCAAQNSNNMGQVEKFNYDYYKSKLHPNTTSVVYTEKDKTVVKVDFDKNYYSIVQIKNRTFCKDVKIYHKNGILWEEGKRFYCSSIEIGMWREYDKEGKLIKETDEDKKFEKLRIKPKDLLRWMESQGWIDLWSGKGQQSSFSNTPFRINFSPHGKDHAKWYISRVTMSGTEEFVIDAETGKVISHENVLNIE